MNGSRGWYTVCDATDLPGGASREFRINGVPGFVLRLHGQLQAFANACPHQSLPLNWRAHDFLSTDRQHIVCANHGALFDPITGDCLAGPCAGAALRAWAVREYDGRIEVTDFPT